MTKTAFDALFNAIRSMNWDFVIKRCVASLVLSVLFFVVFFCPLNRYALNFVLFHPTKFPAGLYDTKTVAGCANSDVYFTASNGNKIHGWYIENPKSRLTILLSHGNGGNLTYRLDMLDMLLQAGASVLTYDYEGYGKSEGEAGVDTACDDALCAYNFLVKDKKVDPKKIVLCGESLGTGITGNLASKVSCAGVILQCPFISLRHRAIELLAIENLYPKEFYPANALDNGAVFSKRHPPLLVVGGAVDHVLPVHHAEDLVAMASEPKSYIRVEEAGHTGDPLLVASPLYRNGLKTFLAAIDNSLLAKP